MSSGKFFLPRRTFLKGTGAALALPLLDAMLDSNGLALAQGAPIPKRFVTWFFGNGVKPNRWTPAATGAGWALSEELAPLVNVKPYVNVVSGYDVKTPNLRGHHNGAAALLSGAPFIPLPAGGAAYSSKFGMISIDQVAADKIAGATTFKSVQIGISKRVTTGEGPTLQYLSHRGPDSPMPTEFNPAALYAKLFAGFTPKDPADPRERLRISVLDAVREDAKRLQQRLGSADRARLDQHLTGLTEVRGQIMALPPVLTSSCVQGTAPGNTNQDVNGVEQFETVNQIMSDVLTLAFACDLTRVASFQFSGSVGGQTFANLGQTDNEHALTHDTARAQEVHEAVVFTMKCFAYLLEKMKASIEGAGNLLDNSCVMATSDVTEGGVHSINDYPILVCGRAGGYLKYPGVHFRGTGQNTSNVLLTCLKSVGTGVTSVGKDSGFSSTECTGIKV